MKRALAIATTLALTLIGSTNAIAQPDYSWSLSGSPTDPEVNTGPALAVTPFTVYLHLVYSPVEGVSAVEFSIATNFFNAGFTPQGGALNAGTNTDLLLAVGGCPQSWTVLGQWVFLDFPGLGGNACLVDSPSGTGGTVDCDAVHPQVHEHCTLGYTTDGSIPCGFICTPGLPVEDASWGSIKGLYR